MSKIIVREYDRTTAPFPDYSNFTVVVPGLVNSASTDFDEIAVSDIVKLNTVDDFKKHIGVVTTQSTPVEAKSAIIANWGEVTPGSDNFKAISLGDFTGQYAGQVYKPELISKAQEQTAGKLKAKCGNNWYKFTKLSVTDLTSDMLEAASEDVGDGLQIKAGAAAVILTGKEGNDEVVASVHLGNQIAYELLKLGYEVIYKKINAESELDTADWWEPFKDRANFDFRYLTAGGYTGTAAYTNMADVVNFNNMLDIADSEGYAAAGRGDCIALLDIDESNIDVSPAATTKGIVKAIAEKVATLQEAHCCNKFTGLFAPHVFYNMPVETNEWHNNKFPASFHYLACAAKAFETYSEWYAVSGYDRGRSDYKVIGTSLNFGDYAANILQPRKQYNSASDFKNLTAAVNLVINVRDNYYLWGNRTANLLGNAETGDLKASDFLNIRQLCCTLKKQVYTASKRFTFDPNSDILWLNFCGMITPLLEKMKADQGIDDYKIIRVRNNRKAVLSARIRIVPIEAVEDFDINVYLEDSTTGAALVESEE